MCETLSDVLLIASQKPTGHTTKKRRVFMLTAPAPWSNPSARFAIDQDRGRVLQKDCPSDVSLGERNPNQCSPSSNGTLTLTGAPLSGTRAATYWQRQRGTRKRRHLASILCTGSCGKAGSPHTIMLRNWRVLDVFFHASPKKLIDMPGCGNSKGTTHSSYQKASPVRRQNFTLYSSV